MAEDPGQEKSEQASDKRREEFRKKGQVAQSREVQTAAMLTGFVLLWYAYGPTFWLGLSRLLAQVWSTSGTFAVTQVSAVTLLSFLLGRLALLLWPILLLVLVVGFLASFLQIGWIFTTDPLTPDFSKLDPVQGMKRFVSWRSFVELIKSLAKIILVGWVAYRTIHPELESMLLLTNMEVVDTLRFLGRLSGLVLAKTCGVIVVLAVVDFLFVRWEMDQKMKMTKQEQKEELRESEGDPYLKARVRSLQMQMSRRRMMAAVPTADVVITNPTHLSVAIVYDRGQMDAPQVVAKGADLVAMRIREIARENKVPMVENVAVARALYQVELGAAVPEDMFVAVAEILAYVYNLKGIKR
ncbi:MAG: flagellar biosynthesis protein FlhB [Desulfobulbaceae bacterium]|nr:flagellar biosynthesis protein FlhB [Desulfobulbaceae bacterium]